MSRRNEFLKKISSRYIKYQLLSLVCKWNYIANKLFLTNQSIDIKSLPGEEIANFKHLNKSYFFVKNISNAIISSKTGATLYKKNDIYNIVSCHGGKVSSNFIKPSINTKNIDIELPIINLIGIHKGYCHFYHFLFDYIFKLLFFLHFSYNDQKILIAVRKTAKASSVTFIK